MRKGESSFSLRITVDKARTQAELDKLLEKVGNFSEPLGLSAMYMERETRLNFSKESDPDGKAWAGLAASTLLQKSTSAILRETGSLVGSIAAEPPSARSVKVSASTSYGIFHQSGTSKMPQRQFLGIGARHVTEINKIFDAYLSS